MTFAPGHTTKTITIQVKGEGKWEVHEGYYVEPFDNCSNSHLEMNRGLGKILNDD